VPASGALALRQPELLAGYETLYAWLDAGGATRRVTIADFDGLRGVVATEPIAKGEAVISVPSALAIDLGVEGSDPLPAARAFLRLWRTLQSAQARGPGEPCSAAEEGALRISPFLKAIPPIGSPDLSTPDFFTPEELAELQWPPIEAEVAAVAQSLRAAADEARADEADWTGGLNSLEQILKQLDSGSETHRNTNTEQPLSRRESGNSLLEQLTWARWVVLSRVLTVQDVQLPLSGSLAVSRPARKLLIPLVDMCNHHLSKWNGIPSGRVGSSLKIIAARDIEQGEQVFIQYGAGQLSNDRLLAEYGFVDGSSQALELDVVMLARALRAARPLGASSAEGLPPLPTHALGRTTLAVDERLLADITNCPPSSRLAAAVRFRAILKRAMADLLRRQVAAR